MAEKRPRIEPDIADRLDRARGATPFERYVNELLDSATGRYWIEPDPDRPRRYRIRTDDAKIVAAGLSQREAGPLVEDLALASHAYNVLEHLYENLSAIGHDAAGEVSAMAERIGDIGDELAPPSTGPVRAKGRKRSEH